MKIEPDQPIVLLTAPTGLAAFNICGVTLHSAFMLRTSSDCAEPSGWEKKSTMQVKVKNLALRVIDEISMVGTSTFGKICSALKKIMQSTDDWGGVSILAVGDFSNFLLWGNVKFLNIVRMCTHLVIWPLSCGIAFSVMTSLR